MASRKLNPSLKESYKTCLSTKYTLALFSGLKGQFLKLLNLCLHKKSVLVLYRFPQSTSIRWLWEGKMPRLPARLIAKKLPNLRILNCFGHFLVLQSGRKKTIWSAIHIYLRITKWREIAINTALTKGSSEAGFANFRGSTIKNRLRLNN